MEFFLEIARLSHSNN